MVGTNAAAVDFVYTNGSNQNSNGSLKHKVDDLRRLLGKAEGDPLRIVGVGAGAWGIAFTTMLQDGYGQFREKVQIRIWRRPGKAVDRAIAEHLFEVINSREDVLRRLTRRCAYLKYLEARLGDRVLYSDEILKDGFCNYLIDHLKFMIQIFDKLCQSFGGDVLETLFNSADGLANCSPETMSYWLWRFIFDEVIQEIKKQLQKVIQETKNSCLFV